MIFVAFRDPAFSRLMGEYVAWCIGGGYHGRRKSVGEGTSFAEIAGEEGSGLPELGRYLLVEFSFKDADGVEIAELYWVHEQLMAGGRPVFDPDAWPLPVAMFEEATPHRAIRW